MPYKSYEPKTMSKKFSLSGLTVEWSVNNFFPATPRKSFCARNFFYSNYEINELIMILKKALKKNFQYDSYKF